MANTYEMKDSGVEWIGDVPKGWEVFPFKKVISQNDGGLWGEDPYGDDGAFVLRSTEQTVDGKWDIISPARRDLSNVSRLDYYRLKSGDLLITKSSGSSLHIGKTSITDDAMEATGYFYSNFMQRVRICDDANPLFFWFILNSPLAREQFAYLQNSTSGLGNINSKHINNLIIPAPPLPEQTAIAAYLDEKCAAIDDIVAGAKATIEEYRKWKASVIFEAVTKGLDPNAEMKDSGVEWIGMVPKGWKLSKMKAFLRNISEKGHPNAQVLSLYREYGVIPKNSRDDNHNVTSEDTGTYKFVRPGNLVINKMKAWQGSLGLSDYEGIISPAYYVCGFYSDKVDKRFLHHLLRSKNYAQEFEHLSTGMRIGQWDLGINDFLRVPVFLPALPEQAAIAAYLDEKCAAIDGIIAEKEALIAELESYKKSLIFETVTGKRRVC